MTKKVPSNTITRILPVNIPVYNPSGKTKPPSHPFSSGKIIEFYRPIDLKKFELHDDKSGRIDWFKQHLFAIHHYLKQPVPYAFCTKEGVRSLDAGCLGHLYNKKLPDILLNCDQEGYIESVVPLYDIDSRILPKRLSSIAISDT